MRHRKVKALSVVIGALAVTGLASLAFAAWIGLLEMPFQGKTADAPTTLVANYSTGNGIDFGTLSLSPTPPATGTAAWSYAYPAESFVELTNPSAVDVTGFTIQLAPGTASPELLAAVHYRLALVNSGGGFTLAAYGSDGTTWGHEGTLADLTATPLTYSDSPVTPDTHVVFRLVFWLDENAPQSVAGQTLTGALNVTAL